MEYINLDITPGSIPPIVNCSQCDIGREIALILFDGTSGEWSIPEGSTVYIIGTKSDGHPFGYDSVSNPDIITWTGSTVTVKTVYQMTAAAGEAECEVRIKSSAQEIYTANFILDVESMAWPQDDELSAIDIPLIVRAVNATTGSEENATLSRSWAVGDTKSRTGEETNNSKYYAEQASKSASSAKTSETNANTYKNNAASSASAAKTSETNANTYKNNAATSASNAKTSETNAKTSETNAKTSETNAASSKSAAASSATAAANSASAAKTSQNAAASSASAAATSASTAANYANNNYAVQAKSYAVGGTGTRTGEDTDNAKYYYNNIKDTDVGNLAELEKKVEANLNAINHAQDIYPAFFADRQASIENLNNCTTNGLYQYNANCTNAPTTDEGLCAVFNSVGSGTSGCGAQFAWPYNDPHTVYARDDNNGAFGSWKKVADSYNLPIATSSVLGGVKVGSNITVSSGTISLSKANVTSALGYTPPTTNTTYGVATSSANGLMSSTDKAHHDAMYTEVYARPNTRKLSTQTLTAEGGTLTWTDDCITDDSLIDVYASIPNIAPSAITQSGTTVSVTFDAQDSAFSVAIVVM